MVRIRKTSMVMGLGFEDGQLSGLHAMDCSDIDDEPYALLDVHARYRIGKPWLWSRGMWLKLDAIRMVQGRPTAFGILSEGRLTESRYHATTFNALLTKRGWLLIPVENGFAIESRFQLAA